MKKTIILLTLILLTLPGISYANRSALSAFIGAGRGYLEGTRDRQVNELMQQEIELRRQEIELRQSAIDNEKFRRVEAEALNGSSDAQVELGKMYAEGKGVTRDYLEAHKWFKAASDQGNSRGNVGLGLICLSITHDNEQAAKWFTIAADQGNEMAQLYLGCMYLKGVGVTKNYDEAERLLKAASDQGNEIAKDKLNRLPLIRFFKQ